MCLSVILAPYSVNAPILSETFYAGSSVDATAKLFGSMYSTSVSAQTDGPTPCQAKANVIGTYIGASGHKMWAYGYSEYSTAGTAYANATFSNCASCHWTAIDGDHYVIKNGVTYYHHSHVEL